MSLHSEIICKKIKKEILRLEKKIIKNQKFLHEKEFENINTLFDGIYFNKKIQERSMSYLPYYMKYGSLFFDILIKKTNPLEKDYIILKGF